MKNMLVLPEKSRKVTIRQLGEKALQIKQFQDKWRDSIMAPKPRKTPPVFTTTEIAEMCNLKREQVQYFATKEDSPMPSGQANGTGRSRSRTFTLVEARAWIQQMSDIYQTRLATSPEDIGNFRGRVIVTAQLKGGSAKTTTTMCMAQALTLRGRRVLVVDLDPQASCSELCGLYAEKDITPEDTVLPFLKYHYESEGLLGKIQPTYWDGLDIIPGHTMLHEAEFFLPSNQKDYPGYRFWTVLRQGFEELRKHYDYILMDTSPSLSYVNLNALFAADAMVMPMIPENLDFISSLTFWSLFNDVIASLKKYEEDKEYSFISILLSRVEHGPTSNSSVVKTWAQSAYEEWLDPFEIPDSSVMSGSALSLSTVFDLSRNDTAYKSLQRVRQPFVDYVRWLDEKFVKEWKEETIHG
ncbi:ParA family protein [Paraburkholderia humisilvae]|uniref:AAA domain-containing protein n=1 Tax=Paraburkholderia humisilvae TaxID=627669 RepID=A0A6J5F5T1_9BURK|nr:AAA family ATPase [Paraburkholderia humisilvae]CAB3774188.1 hypothetical protein LMG29542_07636 [Paraburkholderia humisilvae]